MPASFHRFSFAGSTFRYDLLYTLTETSMSYQARVWLDGTYLGHFQETMPREFIPLDRWTEATVELLAMCRAERTIRNMVQAGA